MSNEKEHAASRLDRLDRLDRLEDYLLADPDNPPLMRDAFATALELGLWARAEFHLRHAQALGHDPVAWTVREAEFWLAQRRGDEARLALERVATSSAASIELADAVSHDLAYIDFMLNDFQACVERLRPRMIPDTSLPPAPLASQLLWLRALHRQGDLDCAHQWALAAEGLTALGPSAAGVASLVAFDLSDYANAMRWSNVALAHGPQMEALVTRASLALGERDASKALALAGSALELNPKDGRAWSVKAFALLLAMELPAAKQSFDQAVAAMPGHIGTWHGLAWTQLLARDIDGAQTSFETALALDRNFGESHGGLAVVLVLKQQVQAAKGRIDRALRLDKTGLSARYAQALLAGEVRDAQAMQRLAQRLLSSRPAPLGGTMADWLPSAESTLKNNGPGKAPQP